MNKKFELFNRDGYDFNLSKPGWWVLHVLSVAGILYLGKLMRRH